MYGTSDYRSPRGGGASGKRQPGLAILFPRIPDYERGNQKLEGLPAVYTESLEEAETLIVELEDQVTGLRLELYYTNFRGRGHSDQERQIYQSRRETPCI